MRPQRRQPTRLPRPWDSPGKNTGVGCHFLLQCMKMKGKSEVSQSCPTLRDPMDCSPPGSSIHGIFQARVLEWGAIAFSALHVQTSKLWSTATFFIFSQLTLHSAVFKIPFLPTTSTVLHEVTRDLSFSVLQLLDLSAASSPAVYSF